MFRFDYLYKKVLLFLLQYLSFRKDNRCTDTSNRCFDFIYMKYKPCIFVSKQKKINMSASQSKIELVLEIRNQIRSGLSQARSQIDTEVGRMRSRSQY